MRVKMGRGCKRPKVANIQLSTTDLYSYLGLSLVVVSVLKTERTDRTSANNKAAIALLCNLKKVLRWRLRNRWYDRLAIGTMGWPKGSQVPKRYLNHPKWDNCTGNLKSLINIWLHKVKKPQSTP
jgi:hypothetical protein